MKFMNCTIACAILTLAAVGPACAASSTSTDFSSGEQGWVGDGFVDSSQGNGAPAYRTLLENFGLTWQNTSNAAWLGNYAASSSVTLGIDVLAQSIAFEGVEVSRDLVVKLTDKGDPANGVPDAVLWYDLGQISSANSGWQHYGVTFGTSGAALPAGWGADDGEGDLVLPPGRTFSDVLANVDEIEFTTYLPGWFYGFTEFDVSVDNLTLSTTAVPEPTVALTMMMGLGLLAARRRRSQR